MKKLLLILFVTFTLIGTLCAASNSVLSGSSPQTNVTGEGSFLLSGCVAGNFCVANPSVILPGDGSPQPLCAPGRHCNNDQFQLRAGDGSPQPLCAPGRHCNNDQEREVLPV
jgi:hypothetical protein